MPTISSWDLKKERRRALPRRTPQTSGVIAFLAPNHWVVKRKTNKKKYRASLRAMKDWLKSARSWPLKMILSSLKRRLRGCWNCYCVIANDKMVWKYRQAVSELVFKWLNRRSQRKSDTWKKFLRHWQGDWQIPRPRVVEQWGKAGRAKAKCLLSHEPTRDSSEENERK